MKNTNIILVGLLALIIGAAAGFFAGSQYSKTQVPSMMAANNVSGRVGPGAGRQFGGPGMGRGGAVTGEILSVDNNSITVKLADGSSKIVLLGSNVVIGKSTPGTSADLTTGTRVAVFGTPNSDGSITAQNVQINPSLGGMRMGGGQAKNTGTPSADAKEVDISGQNYSFTPNKITVPVGQKTRLVFKSTNGFHDFVVDDLNIKTATVQTGDSDWVEFTPTKAGSYQFYCSVGNHKQMGMVGTLTVQ